MEDLFYKLLVLRMPGIGAAKYNNLVQKFGDVRAVATMLGVDDAIRDAVRREMDRAVELGIYYICDDMLEYPAALRAIKNHPPVLSVRGNVETLGDGRNCWNASRNRGGNEFGVANCRRICVKWNCGGVGNGNGNRYGGASRCTGGWW